MASLAEGEAGALSICIFFGRLAVHILPALLELRLAVSVSSGYTGLGCAVRVSIKLV